MYWAFIIGTLSGLYFAHRQSNHILMVLLLFRFRKKEDYEDFYDICDTEFNFDITKKYANTYKTYNEFLLKHQDVRPYAGEIFVEYWQIITRMLIRSYAFVAIFSLILFYSSYLYFLVPFIAVHMTFLVYFYYYKDNQIDFYAIYAHNLVITDPRLEHLLKKVNCPK